MKFFYCLIFWGIIFAIPESFAQQPGNKPAQQTAKPQATQTKQESGNTNSKSGNTASTTTNTQKQTSTTQSGNGKNTSTITGTKAAPSTKTTAAASPKEEQSVELAIIGDTVGMVLHADPRLAMITYNTARHDGQVINGRKTGSIYSARGFRVQIYSGSDRAVATQRKIDFIRRYPGVRTYMTYIAPTFRVKVGDYRDRKSAQNMYQQVSKLCNPCMVVNDIIEVNTFRND